MNGLAHDLRRDRFALNAGWLVGLRWVAVLGQLATVTFVRYFLQIPLSTPPLMGLIGFTAATNVLLHLWWRSFDHPVDPPQPDRRHGLLALVMACDLLSLTGLLYFAGGPTNPFVTFFFVNLTLSAVLLPMRWCWCVAALALACLCALFIWHVPLEDATSRRFAGLFVPGATLHEQGLFVALIACPAVVIYFILRVTQELQRREAELRVAEQRRARSERLEALGTLAAGAGHELATPLSTIAVVAKELERLLDHNSVAPEIHQDVGLIRDEVEHCRRILQRMSAGAGWASGESLTVTTPPDLLEVVLREMHDRQRIRLDISPSVRRATLVIPPQTVAQALRGVLQNALDASPPGHDVEARIQREDGKLVMEVRDDGHGMAPEVLQRAGEPFFTTKEPGKGMGLGLFLSRTVLERLGGELRLQSTPGEGTIATIVLPLERLD